MDEGEPVELGELHYNVTFSRYLNPNDNEDSAYLVGQPEPPKGDSYFGVFFEVQNESDEPQQLPSTLTITDADENEFEVLASESLFALELGGEVEAQEQVPVLDSTAQLGRDRGLAGALPAAGIGLGEPAADPPHPRSGWRRGGEVTLDL